MKRILISAVLALALAGTSAFAAQNKNAGGKKPASKPAATMSNSGEKKPAGKRRHKKRRAHKANSNMGGGTMKKGNKNSK